MLMKLRNIIRSLEYFINHLDSDEVEGGDFQIYFERI
jgi:hypothetical protein